MNLSNLAKFILGFTLAIALTLGGAVAASLYLVARLTALPPKPEFDSPQAPSATPVSTTPTPEATPDPEPTPEPSPTPNPGLYQARVTWPEGLLLRDNPSYDAGSLGGIAFNETVTVLENAENGAWQRVRSESSNQEGWVVGGNLEEISSP
ncbi:hypothetical protein AY600_03330 [Phormidium willei BDU 130791]|nr:hypothetical protein AY600_03330 [Phormidium willei BDU 130791]